MNATANISLQTVISGFERWLRNPDGRHPYSENTIRSYIRGVLDFVGFLERNHVDSLEEVNETWVKSYYKTLKAKNMSNSTLTARMSAIDLLFTYCFIEDIFDENPVFRFKKQLQEQNRRVRGGRAPVKLPPVLHPHEQDEMIGSLMETEHKNAARDLALICLLLDTGLRTSELISLNMVDGHTLLRTGMVRVLGKGNKERVVRSLRRNEQFLRDYLSGVDRGDREPLFVSTHGNRLRQNTVHGIINRHLERAGIEKPQSGGHLLRHTAASEMLAAGWSIKKVQENLGHASLMTTERYLHLIEREDD
ncbi:MAG TPA: hypothetical protein EYP39_08925 [Ghiorsea sp.]|nr:hypothetical protein [Ghiorsea sp.]